MIVHRNTCWTVQIGTHMSFLMQQKILQNPLICSQKSADTLVGHHGTTEKSLHLRLPFGRGKQWEPLHTQMKVVLHCFFNLVEGNLRLGMISVSCRPSRVQQMCSRAKTKGLKYLDYVKMFVFSFLHNQRHISIDRS